MPSQVNRQVRLKSRPTGIPQADNFEIVEATLPEIRDGQFLVRNEYLSVEPAMRGWVSAVANYSTPVGIGEVMPRFRGRQSGGITSSRLCRRRLRGGHARMAGLCAVRRKLNHPESQRD
jgi:NADPH-dependent curcumin reductase CurA